MAGTECAGRLCYFPGTPQYCQNQTFLWHGNDFLATHGCQFDFGDRNLIDVCFSADECGRPEVADIGCSRLCAGGCVSGQLMVGGHIAGSGGESAPNRAVCLVVSYYWGAGFSQLPPLFQAFAYLTCIPKYLLFKPESKGPIHQYGFSDQ